MKIATEFIILHEDIKMPEEERFCPSIWSGENFDSDGDYYYDNIDGRWSNLQISKRRRDDKDTKLEVNVYREHNRIYEPSVWETEDLKRFINYKHKGRYTHNSLINDIENLCIASFSFETYSQDDYNEFLQTIYFYLKYTSGVIVNYNEHDSNSFFNSFID